MKYIPAPLIGLYMFLEGIVVSLATGQLQVILACAVLILFLLLTVVYLRQHGVRRSVQLLLSIAVFLARATTSAGPFQLIPGWQSYMSSLAIGVVAAILVVVPLKPLQSDAITPPSQG